MVFGILSIGASIFDFGGILLRVAHFCKDIVADSEIVAIIGLEVEVGVCSSDWTLCVGQVKVRYQVQALTDELPQRGGSLGAIALGVGD